MASASRTIRVRFDGSTEGLGRAATEAEQIVDGFRSKVKLAGAAITAAGVAAPALLAGATLVFAGLAAAGLASSDKVKGAFTSMGREVRAGFQEDAAVLGDTAVRVAGKVKLGFQSIRPVLRETFSAIGPQVERLTDGVLGLAKNALPGLSRAAKRAGPAVDGLAEFLERTGSGVGKFFDRLTSAAPRAGTIFSSLGKLLEQTLDVLGVLLAVASDFASGALPAMTSGFGGLLSVLSGLLQFLQPIAPQLGYIFGAFMALKGALAILTALRAGVALFGASTAASGLAIGTWASRLSGSAVAGARVARVATSVARALPVVGIAAAAAAWVFDELTTSADEAADAISQGGPAAARAARDLAAQGIAVDVLKDSFGVLGGVVGGAFDAMTTDADEFRASVTGLQAAQFAQAEALARYDAAVQAHGANSQQARDRQRELGVATDKVRQETEKAAAATKSYTERLVELADTIAGQIDKSLAYESQLRRTKDAEKEAADAVRAHGANSQEAKDANFALQEQYAATARAAGEKAKADNAGRGETAAASAASAAYRLELSRLASQQDGPGRTAALGVIDRMGDAELQAWGAANATSGFATQVVRLPSGRTVTIAAATGDARANIAAMLAAIPRQVTVTVNAVANIGRAVGAIGGLGAPRRAGGGPVQAGRSYLVGENGPELFTPHAGGGGRITPNSQMGGGDVVNVIQIGDEVVRVVRTQISEANRAGRRGVAAGAYRGV